MDEIKQFTRREAIQFFSAGAATGFGGTFSEAAHGAQGEVPQRNLKGSYAFVHGEDEPLFAENADALFYTASTIKVDSLACVFQAVREGKLDWNERVRISRYAAGKSTWRSGLEEASVRELCQLAGSASMNDAMIALAERVAAGEKIKTNLGMRKSAELEVRFVKELVNPLLNALGMEKTQCVNSTGFPVYSVQDERNAYETMSPPNNHSTLRERAILVSHVLSEYPDFIDVFSVPSFQMGKGGRKISSGNMLLPGNPHKNAQPCEGVFGLKTGYIYASGHHLICTRKVEGKTIVSMTIGSGAEERAQVQRAAMERAVALFAARKIPGHEKIPVQQEEGLLLPVI